VNASRAKVYRALLDFETAGPALRGEMTIAISLTEADDSTDVFPAPDRLPPDLSTADNDAGGRSAPPTLDPGCRRGDELPMSGLDGRRQSLVGRYAPLR
jgi:hypothetical protein